MNNPLSLSVRIAEGFLSKEESILNLDEFIELAKRSGYDALCIRASQIGIQTPRELIEQGAAKIQNYGLPVTMVTGDFDIVYNNDKGPNCLQNITPFLDLATMLDAPLIRVAIKTDADISAAQTAADEAIERNITLVHQCHTLSLFETIDSCEESAKRINRPNFGIIYEPANLEICDQEYTGEVFDRLRPWIKNVYLQNQRINPAGAVTLDTWCRGPVTFDLLPIHETGGIRFESVISELQRIEYQGPITAHQSAQPEEGPIQTATKTAEYLHSIMG
ncbi:sugar phosphate isomerase/epimerase [bacterium]|jgi:sugar phosphate isomerase/epimerase|nr:sugar phosphate isomerase/epimerase [Verrucomicrobiota bacterium]MDA7500167.1 sugar phosphate isomerase/epimerase [bacterium]MDA7644850.1 sugar phosphate isomerase/epimerase [bacterium]